MVSNDIMVSITVITYNHAKYLNSAIESILNQKVNFKYEIIIGDDASTDSTRDIMYHYKNLKPDIVELVLQDSNIGPTKNFFCVSSVAKGKYIAILEGDDFWIDDMKLQNQVDFLERNLQYIGCASKYLKVDENSKPLKIRYASDAFYEKAYMMKDFLKGGINNLMQSGSLVYRNIYKSGVDYSIIYKGHRMICDGTVLAILLDIGPIYLFAKQYNAYRVKRDSRAENAVSKMSRNPLNYTKSVLEYAQSLEKHFEYKYVFDSFRDIAIDYCLLNKHMLDSSERNELSGILGNLSFKNRIRYEVRYYIRKIRFFVLFVPKKILNWS